MALVLTAPRPGRQGPPAPAAPHPHRGLVVTPSWQRSALEQPARPQPGHPERALCAVLREGSLRWGRFCDSVCPPAPPSRLGGEVCVVLWNKIGRAHV